MVHLALLQFGLDYLDSDSFALVRIGYDRIGSVWLGPARFGYVCLVRLLIVWFGLDWQGLISFVKCTLVLFGVLVLRKWCG